MFSATASRFKSAARGSLRQTIYLGMLNFSMSGKLSVTAVISLKWGATRYVGLIDMFVFAMGRYLFLYAHKVLLMLICVLCMYNIKL